MSAPRAPEAGNGVAAGLRAAEAGATMQQDVGPALRWLRQRRGSKQHQVAELAGITRPMLSAYERGKVMPALDTLEKILGGLGCDLGQLAGAMRLVSEEVPPAAGEVRRARARVPTGGSGTEARAYLSLQESVLAWLDAVREYVLDPENLLGRDGRFPP